MNSAADVDRLTGLLESRDAAVRRVAVRDAADACAPEFVPVIERALADADAGVRLEAVAALDAIGGIEAVAPLILALEDAQGEVRQAAAQALAELKMPEGSGLLLQALSGKNDPWVITALLEALKPLKCPGALQPTLELLGHPDPAVRAAAAGVIGYLRPTEPPSQLVELSVGDRVAAVRLAAMRAQLSAPAVSLAATATRALMDVEWTIRAEAAGILGKIRHIAAVEDLIAVADADPHWQVREQAVEALGLLRSRAAVFVIGRCLDAPVSNLRKTAVVALGRIGDRSVRSLLGQVRDDPDAQVRKLTAQLLERLEPDDESDRA